MIFLNSITWKRFHSVLALLVILSGVHLSAQETKNTPSEENSIEPPALASPLSSVPAASQVDRMIEDVQRRVNVLKKKGESQLATAIGSNLKTFITQRKGPYELSLKAPEVHWVGIYEASNDSPGPVDVQVTYSGAPIILVLSAYDRVLWKVSVEKNVQLKKVVVSGFHEQRVQGLPDSVQVQHLWRGRPDAKPFYAYTFKESNARQAAETIQEITKRPVTTLLGSYRGEGFRFVVGPGNPEWRNQHIIARMRPLHEAATEDERRLARLAAQQVQFNGLHVSGGQGPFRSGAKASWGPFTGNGPLINKHVKLPRLYGHFVVDEKAKKWYAIHGPVVVELDKETGKPTPLPKLPFELPKFSHPCGLTLDKKRNRLLICTLGGKGHLYSFDLAGQKWSLVGSMNDDDAVALAWSSFEDCLYAVARNSRRGNRPLLLRMSTGGVVTREVPLGPEIPSLRYMPKCQLIPHQETMILLAPGESGSGASRFPTHSYLINSLTGEATYAAKLQDQSLEAPE